MEPKVIGAGFFFLASGCGPALSAEDRKFLPTIKHDDFYPLEKLLGIFKVAEQKDPKLVYATGKRWGSLIKAEMDKVGVKDIPQAFSKLAEIYQIHHQGEIGKIVVDCSTPNSAVMTYTGPYPHQLITGAYEALAMSLGGNEIEVKELGENRYELHWVKE